VKRATALPLAVLTSLGLVLGGPAGLAGAAGTGDVGLVPASTGGEPRTSFTVDSSATSIRFELVNLVDAPRTARLYAASADRSAGGGESVGAEGSAPWLRLPDAVVALGPDEARSFTAPLDVAALPKGQALLGAEVMEALQGSVTVRVATLVTVERHTALPLPLWVVGAAGGAIVLALVGPLLARRRPGVDGAVRPARDMVAVSGS
jgi:hypothetical protein